MFERYAGNPIVIPGSQWWRRIASFNPGAVLGPDGAFYLLERALSSLAPMYSHVGLLRSENGFDFELAAEEPVFTAAQLGTPLGTVEDPRVVELDGMFYMTYVHRDYAPSCFPNGRGIPNYHNPVFVPEGNRNNYRSGIARSRDLIDWEDMGLMTPPDISDRDCVLFPGKVAGRYAMLRRPHSYGGPQFGGVTRPSIWIVYSDDLRTWSEPELVATVEQKWEGVKIGAGATPLPTEDGWLVIYHGVDEAANYRTGLLLLDRDDPSKVLARTTDYVFAPETYYERVGLVIPRVVFPSANVVKDGTLYMYYGACDTCICVATAPLDAVLKHMRGCRRDA